MPTADAAYKAHIAGEVTTKAWLWKITRKVDGALFRFTDHDVNIEFPPDSGNFYIAAVGYQQTAITNAADLSINNTEATGYFDADFLTAAELRSGLFDFADVEVHEVNWADLTQSGMYRLRANLGEVRSTPAGIFTAELRGMTQRLAAKVAEIYTPECRADFGSSGLRQCNKDPAPFTFAETVTDVVDAANFTITNSNGAAVDGYYAYGVVTWTSGNNVGRSIEVKMYTQSGGSNGIVELAFPMSGAIQVADTFSIVAGCDKRHDTCRDKFDNIVNRQAEDFIPGFDALLQTPTANTA